MNEQSRHRSQIVGVVLLGISIDNGSEEFKIIQNLWEDVDQGPHLTDLLAETLDDHVLALRLTGTAGVIGVWLVHAHVSCLVHHILKCIVGGLRQEDVVVQELWSDLPQQGYQQSLDGGLGEVGVVDGI